MKKFSNTEVELKKGVAYNKSVYFLTAASVATLEIWLLKNAIQSFS